MALTRERTIKELQYDSIYAPSLDLFGFKSHYSSFLEEGEVSESLSSYSAGLPPILSDPSNSPAPSFVFGMGNSPLQEAQPSTSFKVGSGSDHWGYYSSSSVLSFEQGGRLPHDSYSNLDQEEECALWIDAADQNYSMNQSHDQSFDIGGMDDSQKQGEERFGLLYSSSSSADGVQESANVHNKVPQKRSYMGGDVQVISTSKKQCGANKKSKAKPTSPSKDNPQSIAAKNRRERISERLKILQDLVPNGTKVDLVTMLEKAISYVKFLQLQVKVLATDEFWPTQGGKAPDLSQVKDAIDAILSSQRDHRDSNPKQ